MLTEAATPGTIPRTTATMGPSGAVGPHPVPEEAIDSIGRRPLPTDRTVVGPSERNDPDRSAPRRSGASSGSGSAVNQKGSRRQSILLHRGESAHGTDCAATCTAGEGDASQPAPRKGGIVGCVLAGRAEIHLLSASNLPKRVTRTSRIRDLRQPASARGNSPAQARSNHSPRCSTSANRRSPPHAGHGGLPPPPERVERPTERGRRGRGSGSRHSFSWPGTIR